MMASTSATDTTLERLVFAVRSENYETDSDEDLFKERDGKISRFPFTKIIFKFLSN
jgi:hypothetical protein